jgi:hypothetical protein
MVKFENLSLTLRIQKSGARIQNERQSKEAGMAFSF